MRYLGFESIFTEVNGLRTHARVSRAASRYSEPAIVLVHGLGVSGRYLMPTAALLAQDFPVHVPDLPGFGRSARPRQVMAINPLAAHLTAWMEARGIEGAVLVGNSMGCQVIVEAAISSPQRIAAGVLLGPTMDPAAPTRLRQFLRVVRNHVQEPPSLTVVAAYDYLIAGPFRVAHTAKLALEQPVERRLPLVQIPMLVVRGERDAVVPEPWAAHAADLLHARLVTIPKAGHAVNYNSPRQVARVVRAYIRSLCALRAA